MQWHDISIPLHEGMTVWPGDAEFRFSPDTRVSDGDSCNTSTITLSSHAGTHCDAPWHFDEQGKKLHEVDMALFIGTALILEFPDVDLIRAEHLPEGPLPERVLLKTKNSDAPTDQPFNESYVALDQDAAQRLVDGGVKLVGIDYLSIAPFGNAGPTHHTLLDNDVFIVEGLRLKGIQPGVHPIIIMPLAIQNADGAPCRAFVQQ